MALNWTLHETEFLQNNLHLTTAEICILFKEAGNHRSYDSVQKKVSALRSLEKVLDKRKPLNNKLGTLPELPNLMVPTEAISKDIIQWLTNISNNFKPRKHSLPVHSDGTSLVINLSDNHFGKKTETFNLKIAKERVLSMVEEILPAGGPTDRIDEVCLVLSGDEVEGEDIYSNQNGALECPVIFQAKAAAEAYWQLILNLKETFECKIRVIAVPGNHGRMSRTADTRSNWDNVVYMMLALLADQHPELDVFVDLNF